MLTLDMRPMVGTGYQTEAAARLRPQIGSWHLSAGSLKTSGRSTRSLNPGWLGTQNDSDDERAQHR